MKSRNLEIVYILFYEKKCICAVIIVSRFRRLFYKIWRQDGTHITGTEVKIFRFFKSGKFQNPLKNPEFLHIQGVKVKSALRFYTLYICQVRISGILRSLFESFIRRKHFPNNW